MNPEIRQVDRIYWIPIQGRAWIAKGESTGMCEADERLTRFVCVLGPA